MITPSCFYHRDSKIPEPPAGHQWKEVRSDNTVMWLAAWMENIQNSFKYVILNPSSKPKVRARPSREEALCPRAHVSGLPLCASPG